MAAQSPVETTYSAKNQDGQDLKEEQFFFI
jgi:hypothetical protein